MSLYKDLQESHMQLPWKALFIIFKDLPAIPKKGVLHESGRCMKSGPLTLYTESFSDGGGGGEGGGGGIKWLMVSELHKDG